MEDKEDIEQLLLFHSSHDDDPKNYHSLNDYVERMADGQEDIYYVIADDFNGASRSPHLDAFKQRNIEVLYFDDPIDAVMLMGLTEYKEHTVRSVDDADIDLDNIGEVQEDSTPQKESLDEPALETLHGRFKKVLGGRISDIRDSKSLVGSPARLISEGNNPQRYMYRMNRLLDKDTELPVKILEVNPRHPLIHNLSNMMNQADNQAMVDVVIEQVFETALLQDGIHPDPASMAKRLHILMQAATGSATSDLDLSGVAPVIQEDEPVAEVVSESTDSSNDDETVIEFD
jgi:molecular chaperone HtpG